LAVAVVLPPEPSPVVSRELLYTAVTRGKRLVVVVGHPAALAQAVRNAQPVRRYAGLDQRVRGML
jgi:exodeoxyribonuclease V alpha subunit